MGKRAIRGGAYKRRGYVEDERNKDPRGDHQKGRRFFENKAGERKLVTKTKIPGFFFDGPKARISPRGKGR